jgi:hypothetical protein
MAKSTCSMNVLSLIWGSYLKNPEGEYGKVSKLAMLDAREENLAD